MPFLAELTIADDPANWRAVGFAVADDGCCCVGTVRLRLHPSAPGTGIVGWALAELDPPVTDVDGLPTTSGELGTPCAAPHPLGVQAIDHLVVSTPDLDRTVRAIAALGLPLKRTRDGEAYGRAVRQAFFRMGEVVLEVVGAPQPDPDGGPATFFGLAFRVASLDDAAGLLGPDRMGEPKPAVQPGWRITTIRSAAGLRVPVALMSA